ncbi:MAG: Holliday junction branch migration protein RuvA [Leptospira sp.]|nr:Holliday junction branch migration protein RuvA [Leptospira sp.]
MIATLRGKVIRLEMNAVVIETNAGIGYEVVIPFPTHLKLKNEPEGNTVFLHIHHSITDRSERLFGFLTNQDRELFRVMKSLNGIGELTAIKILSFYDAATLYKIATEDRKLDLEKIPKVKGKTSEKILFELKQNLKKLESFLKENPVEENIETDRSTPLLEKEKDLAILGLLQLGFDEKTAKKEVDRLWKEGIQEASKLIGEILKSL